MPTVTVTPSAAYPQSGDNRSKTELIDEITGYSGGTARPDMKQVAGAQLNRAVRHFNNMLWKFNRITEDITLSSPVSATNNAQFSLSNDWKAPLVAILVDSDGDDRDKVQWTDYKIWRRITPFQKTQGNIPIRYTARTIYREGRVFVDPPLDTSNLTYPTMRLEYFKRIALLVNDTDVLDVPIEVEEAILMTAIALYIEKDRNFRDGREARNVARELRAPVEFEYRDWQDLRR